MSEPGAAREPLLLIVHDYDEDQCEYRCNLLAAAFPHAKVEGCTLRRELLRKIADLPPHREGELWPLALIDLQGTGDRQARGEHLLATISQHLSLRERAVLVAFTRYGHRRRDPVLHVKGARAVVHPELVRRRDEEVVRGFEMLARGVSGPRLLHLGEPASSDDDRRVLALMTAFFPELDDVRLTPQQRWQRALEILHACRLQRDGYEQTAILQQMGWRQTELNALRNQIVASEEAYDPEVFPPDPATPELGGVVDALRPYMAESEAIWEITSEREVLDGDGRLKRLIEVATRDLRDDVEDRAWIPAGYLPTFQLFLHEYQELRHAVGRYKGNAGIRTLVDDAIVRAAAARRLEQLEANYHVVHAALCLEDDQAEEAPLRRRERAARDDALTPPSAAPRRPHGDWE